MTQCREGPPYLEQYDEGYATAIARTFDDLTLNMAQRQLDPFEQAGKPL